MGYTEKLNYITSHSYIVPKSRERECFMELAHIYKGITSSIYPSAFSQRVASEFLNLKRFCFLG